MGNHVVPFKRIPEEAPAGASSYKPLPAKMNVSDLHTTSVEMESVRPISGNNKWHKGYGRLGTPARVLTCRRMKPIITVVACSLLVILVLVGLVGLVGLIFTLVYINSASFNCKQDNLELHHFVNESLDKFAQQLYHHDMQSSCNNSLTLQLQDEVNAIKQQLNSAEIVFSSQISSIQTNLSDLNEQACALKKQVENLRSRDTSFDHELHGLHGSVTDLMKKFSRLENHASNLSTAQEDQERELNMSELAAYLHGDPINITTIQNQFTEQISSLRHNVSQLGNQLNTLNNSMQQMSDQFSRVQGDTHLSDRLGQVENRVSNLNSEIHNPLNLYKSCKEDSTSCSIDPDSTHTDYWRDCPTDYLPIHEEVCYWVET